VLVDVGRDWWAFDGPATARRRPRTDSRSSSRSAESASRRAGFAQPGRGRQVQAERPAGRTAWTWRARSGRLRCAAECRWLAAGIPERPSPGRVALAAGGRPRVVRPEALPAGGKIVRSPARVANLGRSRSPPQCMPTDELIASGYPQVSTVMILLLLLDAAPGLSKYVLIIRSE
jgi:hypothetical protein